MKRKILMLMVILGISLTTVAQQSFIGLSISQLNTKPIMISTVTMPMLDENMNSTTTTLTTEIDFGKYDEYVNSHFFALDIGGMFNKKMGIGVTFGVGGSTVNFGEMSIETGNKTLGGFLFFKPEKSKNILFTTGLLFSLIDYKVVTNNDYMENSIESQKYFSITLKGTYFFENNFGISAGLLYSFDNGNSLNYSIGLSMKI